MRGADFKVDREFDSAIRAGMAGADLRIERRQGLAPGMPREAIGVRTPRLRWPRRQISPMPQRSAQKAARETSRMSGARINRAHAVE